MWDLFKAELLRFRRWAIAYAVLHLLVLGFLTRLVDLAQQPLMIYRLAGGVYVLTGLLLGLYQMGGYRRPNIWLNLLHRPLPHWQVAVALFGAGAVVLMLAIVLPLWVIAGGQELMTARVVDVRHWLMPLAALLIASCGYLAGGYSMLGSKRYAVCALVLPALLWLSNASGVAALAFQALVLVWLAGMVATAFKPDLGAQPRSLPAVIATALPLQMGVYLVLLLLLGSGLELVWTMQGSHPLNSTPPRGGHIEADRAEGKDLMAAGLSRSTAVDAPLWREQVALAEVLGVGSQFDMLPVRFALTNIAPMEFDDEQRRVRWVFSHDSMRFEGRSLADGRSSGSLGVGADGAKFPTPPLPGGGVAALPDGDSALLGSGALYHYNSETKLVFLRVRLPAGELFAGVPEIVGESLAVLSDRALYFFNMREVLENDQVLTPRLRVPMPGKVGNLSRTNLIELVDGYLLSFTFATGAYDGQVRPYQQLLRVRDNGRVEGVARRDISYDFPTWMRYDEWWLSPPLYALRQATTDLFADPAPLRASTPPPVPRSMLLLAGALSLLSLLGATWLTRRSSLSPPVRLAWVAACGLIGVPALLSLWLLYPEIDRLVDLPLAQPAAA